MASRLPTPITEAISNLIMHHPYFAVYMYDLMRIVPCDNRPTAATDGRSIFINTKWFGDMTVRERVFVLAHEICHGMLQHITRAKLYVDRGLGPDFKAFNPKKWNQATDYVINAILVKAGIGNMPSGDNQGLLNPQFTAADIADEVYCKLPDPKENDADNFDEHLPVDPNAPPPDEVDVKRAMSQARNAAKAMGKLPAEIDRMFGEILEPKTNWRQELREYLMVIAGSEETTWAKPHRRKLVMPPGIIYPGSLGYGCHHVVIVNDTSGSISDHELQAFMGEMRGILEDCRPERTTVLWVDSKVSGVDEVEDMADLETLKPKGGGGTDMTASFRWVDDNNEEPDVVVVLTDGYTPFGDEAPVFPVVWVSTSERDIPYGKVIHLEVNNEQ